MKELLKLKRLWLLIAFPIGLAYYLVAKNNAYIAENVFAKIIFKPLSQIFSCISGIFPFSIWELIIVLSPFALITILVIFIRKTIKSKGSRRVIIFKGLINILCAVSVVFCVYEVMSGANYFRYSFTEYCSFDAEDYNTDDLYPLCVELAEKMNEVRPTLESDENSAVVFGGSYRSVARAADASMDKLAVSYPVLKGSYGIPKSVFFSRYMSYAHIVGVYSPFTMESNVDTDVEESFIPSTMCHELSHMRGFMREDEANFISYLACTGSDDPLFRYSGYLDAFIRCSNELAAYDREGYNSLYKMLDPLIIYDMIADNEYWTAINEIKVTETVSAVSETVNDTYLKANSQTEGTRTYSYVTRLILADYKARKAADSSEE